MVLAVSTSFLILLFVGVGAFAALLVTLLVILALNNRKRKDSVKVSNVKTINGVRYTKDNSIIVGNKSVITHAVGDIVLERGKEYIVHKGGEIIPGKYCALSASDETDIFNLRLGGFVREYKNATDIVLGEGDKIAAVSHIVILR